jgi:hypothetical protein
MQKTTPWNCPIGFNIRWWLSIWLMWNKVLGGWGAFFKFIRHFDFEHRKLGGQPNQFIRKRRKVRLLNIFGIDNNHQAWLCERNLGQLFWNVVYFFFCLLVTIVHVWHFHGFVDFQALSTFLLHVLVVNGWNLKLYKSILLKLHKRKWTYVLENCLKPIGPFHILFYYMTGI